MSNHRPIRSDIIDIDDWKDAPYGKFSEFIRKKYDFYYKKVECADMKQVKINVYGQRIARYSGTVILNLADGEDVDDAMKNIYSSDVEWETWGDEDDEIEITDWDQPPKSENSLKL